MELEKQIHTIIVGGKNRRILGYHWTTDRAMYCDLVMVTNVGIEFYKINENLKFSNVRGYQINIGHYWFEATEGILVVSSSPPKLGQIDTFFVYQDKGPKMFNGPRFSIDISPSVTDKWTSDNSNVTNIKEYIRPENDPHHIQVFKIYESAYFIHGNCAKGQIFLHKLTHEKVTLDREITDLKPGNYGIRSVDNLIIVQNYTQQETYIFDIKSDKYATKPFCIL